MSGWKFFNSLMTLLLVGSSVSNKNGGEIVSNEILGKVILKQELTKDESLFIAKMMNVKAEIQNKPTGYKIIEK